MKKNFLLSVLLLVITLTYVTHAGAEPVKAKLENLKTSLTGVREKLGDLQTNLKKLGNKLSPEETEAEMEKVAKGAKKVSELPSGQEKALRLAAEAKGAAEKPLKAASSLSAAQAGILETKEAVTTHKEMDAITASYKSSGNPFLLYIPKETLDIYADNPLGLKELYAKYQVFVDPTWGEATDEAWRRAYVSLTV